MKRGTLKINRMIDRIFSKTTTTTKKKISIIEENLFIKRKNFSVFNKIALKISQLWQNDLSLNCL